MLNDIKDNSADVQLNYIDNNSIDSIDDFQTSAKYITFNPVTNSLGIVNPKVNLVKKNTRISSNNDDENESENNLNEISENKASNIIHIHPPEQEDLKLPNEPKKNIYMDEVDKTNQVVSSFNKLNDSYNNSNKFDISETRTITKENEIPNLKTKISDDNKGSFSDKIKSKKEEEYSPNKKRKKKIIVLEEKKKNKSHYVKSLYTTNDKIPKKEGEKIEKILRKDFNGIPICKKNKKKVKITFKRPFVDVTPIESYKKYNTIMGIPNEDIFMTDTCQCCSIY